MQESPPGAVKGDRALKEGEPDRLGFRDVAAQLAASLVDHASDDGLVVGLEGSWGSGKSSLLHLIEREFTLLPKEQQPSIINFRPWLVGNRDALLANLFSELAREIRQVELSAGDSTGTSLAQARAAGEALRRFAAGLGKVGGVIEVAGDAVGFAPVKWLGSGLKALRHLAKDKPADPPLDRLKDSLISALRNLGHRFIITIDDVDRLEPEEIIEVLRLTRSVADLPNIIYLLCYDSDIISHSIEQAAKIKSGKAYLEKIVQLTIMVPTPETFQLRHWLSQELSTFTATKSEDEKARLSAVIDYEGGRQLRTPRSVIRAIDSMRFFWPPLRDSGADLADLVWLQLIKNGNPGLYRWIEEYSATSSSFALGTARVDDTERASSLQALLKSVSPDYFSDIHYRHYFADLLPGLEAEYADEGSFKLYQAVGRQERDAAIRDRRLASPDHYRLYFALAGPSHALTQANFDQIWQAADADGAALDATLLQLHAQEAAGSLSKADVLLERIRGADPSYLTPVRSRNLLLSFSRVLDDAYGARPFDTFWVDSLWDRAERLVPMLLSKLAADDRSQVITTMFGAGRAVGWLTSLFRHDTFAQGRYGDRKRLEQDWLFTSGEFDLVTSILIGRYQGMSLEQVLSSPDPLSLLFAWRQGGDEEGPRNLASQALLTNVGLLNFLEQSTSTVTSSAKGKFKVLKKENIDPFLDFEAVTERLNAIASSAAADDSARARTLLASLDDGREY